jgi:hypothetical protein
MLTQTNIPMTIRELKNMVKDYKTHLENQYENYFLEGGRKYGGAEARDINQLIYSFAYPKVCPIAKAFHYCSSCKKFKKNSEMTNKYCQREFYGNNCSYGWNHQDLYKCHDCLQSISERDFSFCPDCGRCGTFHYVNTKDLTKSKVSEQFLIYNVFNVVRSLTKKIKITNSRVSWGNSLRYLNVGNKVFDCYSYSFKLSILYPVLKDKSYFQSRCKIVESNGAKYFEFKDTKAKLATKLLEFVTDFKVLKSEKYFYTQVNRYKFKYLPDVEAWLEKQKNKMT